MYFQNWIIIFLIDMIDNYVCVPENLSDKILVIINLQSILFDKVWIPLKTE